MKLSAMEAGLDGLVTVFVIYLVNNREVMHTKVLTLRKNVTLKC